MMAAASVGAANRVDRGLVDRMARFHALADLTMADGRRCMGAVRSEDLPTRGYVGRWHYLISVAGCDLGSLGPEAVLPVNIQALAAGGQVLEIAGWGVLTMWPLDPEVRQSCTAAAQAPADYPVAYPRQVTIQGIATGVWEILIEQADETAPGSIVGARRAP